MPKTRKLTRSKGLDRFQLGSEIKETFDEYSRINELGEKFCTDQDALRAEIEKVEASSLSDDEKNKSIKELECAIEKLKEQYDREVSVEENRLELKQLGLLDDVQDASDEANKIEESLSQTKMDAASEGTEKASDAAALQKQQFDKMKAEAKKKLEAVMQQSRYQRSKISTGKHHNY